MAIWYAVHWIGSSCGMAITWHSRMILAAFKVISSGSPGPTPTAYNVAVINSITFSIRNASKPLRVSPSLNHPITVTCFSQYTVYGGKCHHLDITVPACPLLHIMLHPGNRRMHHLVTDSPGL